MILQLSILSLCFRLSQDIEESNGRNTQNRYRCFVLGNSEIVQPFRNEKSVRDPGIVFDEVCKVYYINSPAKLQSIF